MIVNVIGLGDTANKFIPDGNITIGVNDVINTDYTVCVDLPTAFNNERILNISELKPKGFFTHIDVWENFFTIKKINLKPINAHNHRWNQFIPSSNNSPFVACGIAYKYFNATEIYLWGVDFNDHQNINGAMREQAVVDFKLLQNLLNKKDCKIIPHTESYLYGKI